jgi:UDP-GlcNAc:undecaprenyl-phosphate/decaprenyl-phosphate GlcNAc-1-phosphate transferase
VVGYGDVASAPALITAVLAGACLGFLPHNFSPARIFMGDSGSMLVGLMLAAAAVSATGQADPQTFDSAATLLPLALPLLVPIAILFIPFIDLVMAVVRRSLRGRSPFSPDKMHLHHRLLSIGHSHRRAVLVMYFWAALLSFGAVALSITGGRAELLVAIAVLLVVGIVVLLSPRARRAAREARAAELIAQRQRSRADHPTARAPRAAVGQLTVDVERTPVTGAAPTPSGT